LELLIFLFSSLLIFLLFIPSQRVWKNLEDKRIRREEEKKKTKKSPFSTQRLFWNFLSSSFLLFLSSFFSYPLNGF